MSKYSLLMLIFIFVISIDAQIDRKKRGQLIKKYCQTDREKFCKNAKYGNIIKCLKTNKENISPKCKSILFNRKENSNKQNTTKIKEEYYKQRGKRIKTSCKDDREKFCKNVKYGNIIRCLKTNHENLSIQCKNALKR